MLDKVLDKVVPTIIVGVIMAVFGMYIRIGYLEYVAESAVSRYENDKKEMVARIKVLEQEVRNNREDIIRLSKM